MESLQGHEVELSALPETYARTQDWLVFGAMRWPTRQQLLLGYMCGCYSGALLRRLRCDTPETWRQLTDYGADAAAAAAERGREDLPRRGWPGSGRTVRCGVDSRVRPSRFPVAAQYIHE